MRLSSGVSIRKEAGAALIVALVLLAAITVIGLSNMQSASVEIKMIASQKQRNQSFTTVESALDQIRKQIIDGVPVRLSQSDDLYSSSCIAGRCFTDTCANGRCFFGQYDSTDDEVDCVVIDDADTVERTRVWEEAALWADENRFTTILVGEEQEEVKYITEFLCFGGEEFLTSSSNPLAMLRITARYEPQNGQPIMLHTMVLKKPVL